MKLMNRILDSISIGCALRRVTRLVVAGEAAPIMHVPIRERDGKRRAIRIHSHAGPGGVHVTRLFLDGLPDCAIRWIVSALCRFVHVRGHGWVRCENRWDEADVGFFRGTAGPPPSIRMVEFDSPKEVCVKNLAVKFESADDSMENTALFVASLVAELERAIETGEDHPLKRSYEEWAASRGTPCSA